MKPGGFRIRGHMRWLGETADGTCALVHICRRQPWAHDRLLGEDSEPDSCADPQGAPYEVGFRWKNPELLSRKPDFSIEKMLIL